MKSFENIRVGYPFGRKGTASLAATVTLTVYNMLGQEVAQLIKREDMEAGRHSVEFEAGELASGIYFYHLKAGEFSATKKVMLVK